MGMCRVDDSGRIAHRAIFDALGWGPGLKVTMDTHHEAVAVTPSADGEHLVRLRGSLALPFSIRATCGIRTQKPVFLAAYVAGNLLIIHPADVVARLLVRLHVRGGRDGR